MRLTTCYRLSRTNTFRLASGKLFQKGKRDKDAYGPEFGGNLQNWEKGLRRLALADDGCSFAQVDQAGAEALIVAYLCPPGRYRDLFLYGIKPHVYVGVFFPDHWVKQFPCVEEFATIPIPDLHKHPEWARFAKAVAASDENPAETRFYYLYKKTCHAGNYGIMENTFIEAILGDSNGQVALSPAQGGKLLSTYRDVAFPELHAFHHFVNSRLERDGELRNLFGYPRRFRSLKTDPKEAYAFIPQSTVGCITSIAATNFCNYALDNKLSWIVLNNCHDSDLIQAPDEEIVEASKLLHTFMCQALVSPRGEKFSMKASVAIGKNWGSWSEKKNPNGLKEIKF